MIRHAFILSAGWGTRFRPLTFFRPKALMPIGDKTLLEHWLLHLDGCHKIFVNTHALTPLFHEHIKIMSSKYRSLQVLYEPRILGSGGSLFAISKAMPNEWMIATNGDSFLSSPELKALFQQINLEEPSVYLVLKDEPGFNNIVVAPEGFVRHIRRPYLTETELYQGYRVLAYIGVQIFHTNLVAHYGSILAKRLQPGSSSIPFMDIMDIYIMMIEDSVPVRYLELTEGVWYDVGEVSRYVDLSLALCNGYVIGKNVTLEPRVELTSSILWDGVRIRAGSRLDHCIVTDGVVVDGDYKRAIITPSRVWKF
jgi:NDP-sugar pyrophosphorylase family protein